MEQGGPCPGAAADLHVATSQVVVNQGLGVIHAARLRTPPQGGPDSAELAGYRMRHRPALRALSA